MIPFEMELLRIAFGAASFDGPIEPECATVSFDRHHRSMAVEGKRFAIKWLKDAGTRQATSKQK